MIDPSRLLPFFAAALVLLLTPGPAVLYITARGLDQGLSAGLMSVLGIETGNLCHVLAATLGLSALLLSAPQAFAVVRYLGAGYLVYLGIRRMISPTHATNGSLLRGKKQPQIYMQGLSVAILNPKTALFFLAFLPQFVEPARGSAALQFLLFGLAFVSMAIVTDSLYAVLSGIVGPWIRQHPWFLRIDRYVVGLLYVGLGIAAAMTR